MDRYSMSHLAPRTLRANVLETVSSNRRSSAVLLAELGEIDSRKLYVPYGHSSMMAFCRNELGFDEDAAEKRICAARACRRHPALFPSSADGRLSLSKVLLLAPHLTTENADDLLRSEERRVGK